MNYRATALKEFNQVHAWKIKSFNLQDIQHVITQQLMISRCPSTIVTKMRLIKKKCKQSKI